MKSLNCKPYYGTLLNIQVCLRCVRRCDTARFVSAGNSIELFCLQALSIKTNDSIAIPIFTIFSGQGRRCHSCALSIKVVKSNKINKNCRIFFLEECALGVIIFTTRQRSKRLPSVTAGDAAEALETWTAGKTSDLRVGEGPPVNEASKES